jgi:hypothetical protein
MRSGWKINFKNGYRIILTEKAYEKYQKETPKEDVRSEEHWFNLDELLKKYPEVDFIEEVSNE